MLFVIAAIALIVVAYKWGKAREEKRILDLLMELKPFGRHEEINLFLVS